MIKFYKINNLNYRKFKEKTISLLQKTLLFFDNSRTARHSSLGGVILLYIVTH